MRANRSLRTAAALLLGGALLVGCSASSDDSTSSGDSAGSSAEVADESAADTAAGLASGDQGAATQADREIITTGTATVVADDPISAVQEIVALAEDAGGRIESRSQSQSDGASPATAELTIRVPSTETTTTVDGLSEVGEVRDLSIEAVDVTGTAQDLDARMEALSASVDRLLALMESATTTEDLLDAEREVTTRQAELESLQSQRAALTDQVSMSTLHISVVQVEAAEELAPGGFLGGLQNGWDALVATINGLVVVVGLLLPWLVVLGVVLLVARWAMRRWRRNRPDRGTPPTVAMQPGPGQSGPDRPGTGAGPSAPPAAPPTPLVGTGPRE